MHLLLFPMQSMFYSTLISWTYKIFEPQVPMLFFVKLYDHALKFQSAIIILLPLYCTAHRKKTMINDMEEAIMAALAERGMEKIQRRQYKVVVCTMPVSCNNLIVSLYTKTSNPNRRRTWSKFWEGLHIMPCAVYCNPALKPVYKSLSGRLII
jgi:hypothetical protein